MKTVIRYDRGSSLRSPATTPQGFLRVDGHAARVGIYKYRNADGSTRLELRPPEEVFHVDSLASYDAASATNDHPAEEVTADNVRKYEVGTVSGAGRQDGDRVAISAVIKDAKAIAAARAGRRQLSPGYRIRLDETPGEDARYASPDNPRGRYDAVQRDIRVNHLALVDHARGGAAMALRLDAAERVDGDDRITTSVDDHQHTLEMCGDDGHTSYAGGKPDTMHCHGWIRSADGTVTIAESLGHTHALLDEPRAVAPGFAARGDAQIDRLGGGGERGRMANASPDIQEQNRLLTVRADELEAARAQLNTDVQAARADADALRAELTTTKERVAALEAQVAAGAAAVETVALTEQRKRADAAELEVAKIRQSIPELVRKRASLVARVDAIINKGMRFDSMSDRDVLIAGIRHLRPKEDVGPHVSDDFLASRFDSLFAERARLVESTARATAIRTDAAPSAPSAEQPIAWRDQWRAGAGQFATSHRKEP